MTDEEGGAVKKNFKFYMLLWLIFLIAFNAIVFLVRPIILGYEINYDARFFIAWLFVNAAFVCNLLCAKKAFQAENMKKLFYNLSLIGISSAGLIGMLVLGCILMLIPDCPAWMAAVVCVIIAAFTAIAVVKADWAVGIVEDTEDKVKENTAFIRSLTAEAQTLQSKVKTSEAKAAAKKVYEALRYSDPVSTNASLADEAIITAKFSELTSCITSCDEAKVVECADEFVQLVKDRNNKCRMLKSYD